MSFKSDAFSEITATYLRFVDRIEELHLDSRAFEKSRLDVRLLNRYTMAMAPILILADDCRAWRRLSCSASSLAQSLPHCCIKSSNGNWIIRMDPRKSAASTSKRNMQPVTSSHLRRFRKLVIRRASSDFTMKCL